MKSIKILNFLLLLSVLIISSCNKDDDMTTNNSSGQIAEELVTATISGTVVDEGQNPMENVMVQIGANTSSTDAFGVFSFKDIEVNGNGAVVSVEKAGYFNSTKNVLSNAGQTSNTKIMLIEKVVTSTFDATTGGISTMNGGAQVEFSAAAVKLEGGGTYSGNVNVYATYLDPTSDDLALRMPGDLRATNSGNQDVMLETYGMMGVELEGDNGEALNIADGQTATISIPVPASLAGSAPSTIPLWHFDEATGFWVEEGEATLTNNNTYVGTVSHFSFWNFDVPYPLIHIEGNILDDNQNGMQFLQVEITMNSTGVTMVGWTNSQGLYEGYVPQDEALTLTVVGGQCWEQLYTADIGPLSSDAVVPDIMLSSADGNFITIIGQLEDCNNEVEDYGYVLVDQGYWQDQINVNQDGNFNGTVSVCDAMELSISGVSIDPFSQGTTTVHSISGLTELNVGTLITCW